MAKKEQDFAPKITAKDRERRKQITSSMSESERRAHLRAAEQWTAGEKGQVRAAPTLDEIEKRQR